jgi:hypothetical protein
MTLGRKKYILMTLGALFLFLLTQTTAHADSFTVTINTAPLVGTSAQYEVYLAFTDGGGTGDGNNSASLTNFALGGGTIGPLSSVSSMGDASGNLTSGINVGDSSAPYSGLVAGFTPGSTLSFDFSMSTNPDSGSFQDQMLFFIWNIGVNSAVPTTDRSTPDSFLSATVCPTCSGGLSLQPFNIAGVSATTIVPNSTATPEPASLLLLGSGFLALGLLKRRFST